jgi:hypothetical protein
MNKLKIGDIINIHPDSAYLHQGILYGLMDKIFMDGVVISQYEYELLVNGSFDRSVSIYSNIYNVLTIYVRWENNTQNTYRYKDLILSDFKSKSLSSCLSLCSFKNQQLTLTH